MKKLFFVFAILAMTVMGYSQIPAVSKTVAWENFSTDTLYKDIYTEALAFANAGPKGQVVDLDIVNVSEVWDITDVPSRSGIKETQELFVYETNGEIKYALVEKEKAVLENGKLKVLRGDSCLLDEWYW